MRTTPSRFPLRPEPSFFARISFSLLSIPCSCDIWVVYSVLLSMTRLTYALLDFTTASFSLIQISAQTVSLPEQERWRSLPWVLTIHIIAVAWLYSSLLSLTNVTRFDNVLSDMRPCQRCHDVH
ncbi:hypothetical protein ARMGADRAFT_775031 [Armillaria gallica]|uniref:Uncharacterized protein n=1 Tax=Armillaria gallica TaxID=47427 RepID=A0A2H3CRE7_ARMGA|nr:hypothetical protein ARMGADRAFT_775031 [Armillaria gallica]